MFFLLLLNLFSLISSQKSENQTCNLTYDRKIGGKQKEEKVVQNRSLVVFTKKTLKILVVRVKIIKN